MVYPSEGSNQQLKNQKNSILKNSGQRALSARNRQESAPSPPTSFKNITRTRNGRKKTKNNTIQKERKNEEITKSSDPGLSLDSKSPTSSGLWTWRQTDRRRCLILALLTKVANFSYFPPPLQHPALSLSRSYLPLAKSLLAT